MITANQAEVLRYLRRNRHSVPRSDFDTDMQEHKWAVIRLHDDELIYVGSEVVCLTESGIYVLEAWEN